MDNPKELDFRYFKNLTFDSIVVLASKIQTWLKRCTLDLILPLFSEDTPKKSKKKRERTPDPTDPVVIAERAAEHTAEALAEAEARAKAEEESKPSKIEECKYYTSLTLGKYKILNPHHPESQI